MGAGAVGNGVERGMRARPQAASRVCCEGLARLVCYTLFIAIYYIMCVVIFMLTLSILTFPFSMITFSYYSLVLLLENQNLRW